MSDLNQQLVVLLTHETGLYRELLELLNQERKAAVHRDLVQLQQVGRIKEELMDRVRRLEGQRRQALLKLAARLAVPAESVTLNALVQRLDEPHSRRLSRVRAELATVVQAVQVAIAHNRALLAHSIDLLKGSYQLLNRLTADGPVYARTGSVFSNGSGGRIFSGQV